jgi:FkbM family methyltransferase
MDRVFENYDRVLKYFVPISYLDIGSCKGHHIPYILNKFNFLKKVELIEACLLHDPDLKKLSEQYDIHYRIEVLSDSIKEVNFYLDGLGSQSTGPGNSYYKEDTPHYVNCIYEKRITNYLDNIYKDDVSFDLIKMDTQGSELDIIKGGLKLISKTKGIILEENIHQFNFGAPLHEEVKLYMKSIGFILTDILDNKEYEIKNSNNDNVAHHEIDTLYIREDILNT